MDFVGPTPGVSYDQLRVTGTVRLDNARLEIVGAATLPPIPTVILIDNDGADAVVGNFAGLAEGAKVQVGGREFTCPITAATATMWCCPIPRRPSRITSRKDRRARSSTTTC